MLDHVKKGIRTAIAFYKFELENDSINKESILSIKHTYEEEHTNGVMGRYNIDTNTINIDTTKCSNEFTVSLVYVHELWHYLQFHNMESLLLTKDPVYYYYNELNTEWSNRHVEAEAVFVQCLYLMWLDKEGLYSEYNINAILKGIVNTINEQLWNELISTLDNNELKNKLNWR